MLSRAVCSDCRPGIKGFSQLNQRKLRFVPSHPPVFGEGGGRLCSRSHGSTCVFPFDTTKTHPKRVCMCDGQHMHDFLTTALFLQSHLSLIPFIILHGAMKLLALLAHARTHTCVLAPKCKAVMMILLYFVHLFVPFAKNIHLNH